MPETAGRQRRHGALHSTHGRGGVEPANSQRPDEIVLVVRQERLQERRIRDVHRAQSHPVRVHHVLLRVEDGGQSRLAVHRRRPQEMRMLRISRRNAGDVRQVHREIQVGGRIRCGLGLARRCEVPDPNKAIGAANGNVTWRKPGDGRGNGRARLAGKGWRL